MAIMVGHKVQNLAYFSCSQLISLQNKCKVRSSTFSTGNSPIQVDIVSLQVKVTVLHNGSASWPSSLFSERFSESGRSNVGSGSCTLLEIECP